MKTTNQTNNNLEKRIIEKELSFEVKNAFNNKIPLTFKIIIFRGDKSESVPFINFTIEYNGRKFPAINFYDSNEFMEFINQLNSFYPSIEIMINREKAKYLIKCAQKKMDFREEKYLNLK